MGDLIGRLLRVADAVESEAKHNAHYSPSFTAPVALLREAAAALASRPSGMGEGMIEVYLRQKAELDRVGMVEARRRAREELNTAYASLMGGVLGQLAANDAMAAVLIRDQRVAAEAMASSMKYQTLAALAYAGTSPEKIVELMKGGGPRS